MRFTTRAPGRRSSRLTRPGGKTTIKSTITPITSARTGSTAPPRCCVGCWDAPTRDLVLSRALYATQFTRHLDRHGYLKFKHWRFFGENGLAGEEVSVWVYENTLKVDAQATALSLYSVQPSSHQHEITEMNNHRTLTTLLHNPDL